MTLDVGLEGVLKENYVAYDPWTMERSEDFSCLEESGVILIGNIHYSLTVRKAEELVLRGLLSDGRKTQLFIEGVPVGMAFGPNELPFFQDMPKNLTISGSDARKKGEKEEELRLERRDWQLGSLCVKQRCRWQKTMAEIAQKVTDLLTEGDAEIDQGSLKIPTLSYAAFERGFEELEKFQNEIDGVNEQLDSREETTTTYRLEESNCLLAEQILDHCELNARVVAIWGEMHFLLNDLLFDALERKGIHYTVLLPNDSLLKKTEREHEYNGTRELPVATWRFMHMASPSEVVETTVEIPLASCPLFPPEAQKSITLPSSEEKEETPLIYTPESFEHAFSNTNQLTIPANKVVRFEKFRSEAALFLADLKGPEFDQTTGKIVIEAFLDLLKSSLIMNGKRVGILKMPGPCDLIPGPLWVEVSSSAPWTIGTKTSPLETRADVLFRQMRGARRTVFDLQPNQMLNFSDLTVEKREEILTNPGELFLPWLKSKVPHGYGLELKGPPISVYRATISALGIKHDRGIGMTAQNGCRLTLIAPK